MDAIGLILTISFVVFIFGLYADSGSSSSEPQGDSSYHSSIEYFTVPKGK